MRSRAEPVCRCHVLMGHFVCVCRNDDRFCRSVSEPRYPLLLLLLLLTACCRLCCLPPPPPLYEGRTMIDCWYAGNEYLLRLLLPSMIFSRFLTRLPTSSTDICSPKLREHQVLYLREMTTLLRLTLIMFLEILFDISLFIIAWKHRIDTHTELRVCLTVKLHYGLCADSNPRIIIDRLKIIYNLL